MYSSYGRVSFASSKNAGSYEWLSLAAVFESPGRYPDARPSELKAWPAAALTICEPVAVLLFIYWAKRTLSACDALSRVFW